MKLTLSTHLPIFKIPYICYCTLRFKYPRELGRGKVIIRAPVISLGEKKKSGELAAKIRGNRTCAMTMRSAHPAATPVDSKVPSCTWMRLSFTECSKTLRMPALGSTAMYSPSAEFHSASLSSALVKIPVPDPILSRSGQLEISILFPVYPLRNVIWPWTSQCLANVIQDIRLVTRADAT